MAYIIMHIDLIVEYIIDCIIYHNFYVHKIVICNSSPVDHFRCIFFFFFFTNLNILQVIQYFTYFKCKYTNIKI